MGNRAKKIRWAEVLGGARGVAYKARQPSIGVVGVLKPVDDQEVWSVTCFFIEKKHRHKGIAIELLKAAVEHVKQNGGTIVEGYPLELKENQPDPFVFTGTASAFIKAGFQEAARNSPTRPVFRYVIQ